MFFLQKSKLLTSKTILTRDTRDTREKKESGFFARMQTSNKQKNTKNSGFFAKMQTFNKQRDSAFFARMRKLKETPCKEKMVCSNKQKNTKYKRECLCLPFDFFFFKNKLVTYVVSFPLS